MPATRDRLTVAVLVAAVAGAMAWQVTARLHAPTDFDATLFAAGALLRGENPYLLIGPDRAFPWAWGWSYPVPAGVVAMPLTFVPRVWANVLFVAGGFFALTLALTRRSFVPLFLLASAPALMAVRLAQWSPWLVGAMLLPGLAWLVVVKPNMGVVALAGMPVRGWIAACVGAFPLMLVSFRVLPLWNEQWRASIDAIPVYVPLVMRPGGVLLLLALTRWRRWDARVLLVSTLIPGTPATYDALLPMAAVMLGSGRREAMVLCLVSFLSIPLGAYLGPRYADERGTLQAVVTMATVYVPLVVAVMRRRNVETVALGMTGARSQAPVE